MRQSFLLGILALIGPALAQEKCAATCAQTLYKEKEIQACKEGCRLRVIFTFVARDDHASAKQECFDGCAKSYNTTEENEACYIGCSSQPDMKKGTIRVSITNDSPAFQVARNVMDRMMTRIEQSFPSFDGFFPISTGKDSEGSFEEKFGDMHRYMQSEMARFQQIAQNLLNLQRAKSVVPVVADSRPESLEENAMEGPSVGNRDESGEEIIKATPVEAKSIAQVLANMSENPTVVQVEDSSLLSRLATRARRLSVLSQWLVCAALFLCLISMLSISVAIIKQIKAQRYQNLRNAHIMMAPAFTEPLPAKKIPLDAEVAVVDYAVIHDSPPPAYDQLSVHKAELKEQPDGDPKI